MADEILPVELAIAEKVIEAIPEASWQLAIRAATETVLKLVAPLTETTSGLGRIISGTFDGLEEWRKIVFARILRRAEEKTRNLERISAPNPSPRLIVGIIEEASRETEPTLQELWANLLSQVFVGKSPHPDIPRILARLSPDDALTLLNLSKQPPPPPRTPIHGGWTVMDHTIWTAVKKAGGKISYDVLRSAGLVDIRNADWVVTSLGEAFIAAVSEPPPQNE